MKFRIWNKLEKRMTYPEDFNARHFSINMKGRVVNLQNGEGHENLILMPCIEQNTKFGDIYMGDILKVENLGEWWDHENTIPEEDKYHYCFIRDHYRFNYKPEIFNAVEKSGNIFENPEIIEVVKEKYRKITGGKELPDSSFQLSEF